MNVTDNWSFKEVTGVPKSVNSNEWNRQLEFSNLLIRMNLKKIGV
jgi:hypothetical protein